MNTKKQRNSILLLAVLLLNLLSFRLYSQGSFDPLQGDGLDFSHGYAGWTAKTGNYSSSTSSTPNWNWQQTHSDPTVPQDNGGKFFQIFSDPTATDNYSNNILKKVPAQFGCQYSSQINNHYGGASCSQLQYTFIVSPMTSLLTIYYAMVLETPHQGEHYVNPTFQIDVMAHDPNTQQITNNLVDPCAFFEQSGDLPSYGTLPTGWHRGMSGWVYCDWQQVKINLKKYEGDRVTLRVRLSDCCYSAHGGYGYIAAKTEPAKIDVPGCAGNGDTVTVAYAPAGFEEYKWFEIPNTFLSQDELANADATATTLSTEEELVVTNTMMSNESVKYYACRIKAAAMYPTWGTPRPQCAAYITTQINDIRPIFNLQVIEPTAADPAGRTIFSVNDVQHSGAPLYWQQYDFGDGTTPIQIKSENNKWVVINGADNLSTEFEYDANGSLSKLVHTYANDGEYTYTRTVKSSEDPEADELVYCEKAENKQVVIPKVPSLVLTAEQKICVGEIASITASSPEDEGEELIYEWWHSDQDIEADEPINRGTAFEEQIVENTTYIVKVTNGGTGYYRIDSIEIQVEAFPDVTLEGATKLCMGDRAVITASDATGNAEAFEWTFTRPSNPPVMRNPSPSAVLDFAPTQDTIVYLIARTSVGCMAYDSLEISVIDPQASVSKKEICPGESVDLIGENAVDYSWTANPPDESLSPERVTTPLTVMPQQTTTYTMSGYGETGCHTDKQVTVTVYQYPEATISITPAYVDVDNPILSVSDISPNAHSSSWTFSDGGTSEARSVTYSFNDLSVDSVGIQLISYNKIGCADTTSMKVPVELFAVWMPNAFSPNGDGVNDKIFFTSLNNLEDVHFEIFNRQGTKLFQAHEKYLTCGVIPNLADLLGWDGTYKDKDCPQGTYIYRLQYRRAGNSKVYDKTGSIMLLR